MKGDKDVAIDDKIETDEVINDKELNLHMDEDEDWQSSE